MVGQSLMSRLVTWKPLAASQRTGSCCLVQRSKSYSASLYISQYDALPSNVPRP